MGKNKVFANSGARGKERIAKEKGRGGSGEVRSNHTLKARNLKDNTSQLKSKQKKTQKTKKKKKSGEKKKRVVQHPLKASKE